ncbi:hypothetical protein GUJ93_ZPchr0008g13311 [Zizania palustris]|uniref:Uncharacterized protein n=1 Tax=Zizania palustris TaxID=103762 RepID=A0A8J5R570_ZIZPA|nr:hypothetical protein GUJ93_ZPchr0008g13311 [Zizania palustris]
MRSREGGARVKTRGEELSPRQEESVSVRARRGQKSILPPFDWDEISCEVCFVRIRCVLRRPPPPTTSVSSASYFSPQAAGFPPSDYLLACCSPWPWGCFCLCANVDLWAGRIHGRS